MSGIGAGAVIGTIIFELAALSLALGVAGLIMWAAVRRSKKRR